MGSAIAILGVVSLQAASGTIWWALARRRGTISAFEGVGGGLAVGTFASMLSAMLLAGTWLDAIAWALPALLTALAIPPLMVARRVSFARFTWPRYEALAVIMGVISGAVILIGNWTRVPLTGASSRSFTDLFFFEALSRGLAEFGPGQSILMVGGSLRYHWFTYAWAGELAQTTSSAPFVSITRVLPLVTLIGMSMLASAWAASLSRVRWVPTLAVLLITAGGYAGGLYGSILNFDSPSQSMTTLWLVALAVVFLRLADGSTQLASGLVLVALLSVAVTGGKVSHAVVAAGGIALVAVAAVAGRYPRWRRTIAAAALSAGVMATTYVVVLSGVAIDRNLTESVAVKASTWQGLDPFIGRLGVALGTCALLLAILARLAGMLWLVGDRTTRRWDDTLFVVGGLLVGVAAMLLLSEGVNELWFVLAASAPAAVLSAVGVGRALEWAAHRPGRLRRPLLWAIATSIPASLSALVLSRNWPTHQALLNWAAPIAAWVLVVVVAVLISIWRQPGGRILRSAVALSVAALTITSIGTRPSSIWTSSRPITTERGEIAPVAGSTALPAPTTTSTTPAVGPSDVDVLPAARWLDSSSATTDIVATTDPVSAEVPALTGRQMFLAGDLYQVGLGRADEIETIDERRAASRSLASGLEPATISLLCSAGVDWIWAPTTVVGPPLPVAYRDSDIAIFTLPPEYCSAG